MKSTLLIFLLINQILIKEANELSLTKNNFVNRNLVFSKKVAENSLNNFEENSEILESNTLVRKIKKRLKTEISSKINSTLTKNLSMKSTSHKTESTAKSTAKTTAKAKFKRRISEYQSISGIESTNFLDNIDITIKDYAAISINTKTNRMVLHSSPPKGTEDIEIKSKFSELLKNSNQEQESKSSDQESERNFLLITEAFIIRERFTTGWDKISVHTYKDGANAFMQSFLAGYIEGRITAPEIDKYTRAKDDGGLKGNKTADKILGFFDKVDGKLAEKLKSIDSIESSTTTQLQWSRLLLGYIQLKGLLAGYLYEAKRNDYKLLSLGRMMLQQADGELPELLNAFGFLIKNKNKKIDVGDSEYFKKAFGITARDPHEIWKKLLENGRCSAFIKLVRENSDTENSDNKEAKENDNLKKRKSSKEKRRDDKTSSKSTNNGRVKDLLMGHTTWGGADEMLRIYKYNDFAFEGDDDLPSSQMTFSAYPGTLSSTDDFYITNNKLAITETTISVVDINQYLGMKNTDNYIPNYMRVLAATRFAKSAKEWTEIFSEINSGTYSSQWLILDYNKFYEYLNQQKSKANPPPPPTGLFYILEQIPRKIVTKDATSYLWEHSFFGGYNRAFFSESSQSLHKSLIDHQYAPILYDYSKSRRLMQFQFLSPKVFGLKSIMKVMRFNGYKQHIFPDDPSNGSASDSIAARYDVGAKLDTGFEGFVGGDDSKVTDSKLVLSLGAIAVNGPTWEFNENLPPFTFKEEKAKYYGLQRAFKMPFILMNPETIRKIGGIVEFGSGENFEMK